MIVLRAAMVAAGVPEALVYKKFISNDSWLVSPIQSRTIAKKLTTWLRGDHLELDLVETNANAHWSLDALSAVVRAVGSTREKAELAQLRRAKSLPCRVDPDTRKAIREFAAFCAGSGGFHVC
jgi:hypothetical protein